MANLSFQKHLKIVKASFFFLIFIFSISGFVFYLEANQSSKLEEVANENTCDNLERNKANINDYQTIVGENIVLKSFDESKIDCPEIDKILQIKMISKRPNMEIEEQFYDISIKKRGKEKKSNCKIIKSGEITYLLADDNGYRFSDKKTELFIKPTKIDDKNVNVDVSLNIFSEKKQSIKTKSFKMFCVENVENSLNIIKKSPAFSTLLNAKAIGPDLLKQKLSRNEKTAVQRLEVKGDKALYVKERDLLHYKNGRWQFLKESDTDKYPAAMVKSITDHSIELEGWEDTKHYQFQIFPTSSTNIRRSAKDMLSSIRLCTRKKISFLAGNQHLMLREGDFLVRKNGKWRILKKPNIEKFESYGVDSDDFFVFEKLETNHDEKIVKGFIFNHLRNKVENVSIPITFSTKKKNKRSKIK
jgi:hypothetical protein